MLSGLSPDGLGAPESPTVRKIFDVAGLASRCGGSASGYAFPDWTSGNVDRK